jgi:hypothetical protein
LDAAFFNRGICFQPYYRYGGERPTVFLPNPPFVGIRHTYNGSCHRQSLKINSIARQVFAGGLLFAMGLQNALVSVISRSVVRTTHLTGTFTDLGIELARLIIGREENSLTLRSGIRLKIIIILFFTGGALLGASTFRHIHFYSFFIPAFTLVYALLYDAFRVNVKRYYRKIESSIKKNKPGRINTI